MLAAVHNLFQARGGVGPPPPLDSAARDLLESDEIWLAGREGGGLGRVLAASACDIPADQTQHAVLRQGTTDESQGRLDLLGAPLAELGLGVGDDELKRRVWDCGSAALLAVLTA